MTTSLLASNIEATSSRSSTGSMRMKDERKRLRDNEDTKNNVATTTTDTIITLDNKHKLKSRRVSLDDKDVEERYNKAHETSDQYHSMNSQAHITIATTRQLATIARLPQQQQQQQECHHQSPTQTLSLDQFEKSLTKEVLNSTTTKTTTHLMRLSTSDPNRTNFSIGNRIDLNTVHQMTNSINLNQTHINSCNDDKMDVSSTRSALLSSSFQLLQTICRQKRKNISFVSMLSLFSLFLFALFFENTTIRTILTSLSIEASIIQQVYQYPNHVIVPRYYNYKQQPQVSENNFHDKNNINPDSPNPNTGIRTTTATTTITENGDQITNNNILYSNNNKKKNTLTLRDVLYDPNGFHLGMAPAFFGFYGYFGILDAFDIALRQYLIQSDHQKQQQQHTSSILTKRILSVAGASAGAMAAVLIGSGIHPNTAATFVKSITINDFADFPGIFAFFKGTKFENLMYQFIYNHTRSTSTTGNASNSNTLLENAIIPTAVTVFDIQSMTGKILHTGSMARAARASATFPLLFQPVGWKNSNLNNNNNNNTSDEDYLLIDGGITDPAGLVGLSSTISKQYMQRNKHSIETTIKPKIRIVNLCIGPFGIISPMSLAAKPPPGPESFYKILQQQLSNNNFTITIDDIEIISISIQNLPQPGPWAMYNGPIATSAARDSILQSLDVPLLLVPSSSSGKQKEMQQQHYELHIDASTFWKK